MAKNASTQELVTTLNKRLMKQTNGSVWKKYSDHWYKPTAKNVIRWKGY
jgi:hypothetical protein